MPIIEKVYLRIEMRHSLRLPILYGRDIILVKKTSSAPRHSTSYASAKARSEQRELRTEREGCYVPPFGRSKATANVANNVPHHLLISLVSIRARKTIPDDFTNTDYIA